MRDPAAGRYIRIAPRQLPLACLTLGEAPPSTDRHLPRGTGAGRSK
jgi:hypothetical protein